jgi:diguanylate cyclase (GGDEF)-like protein
MRKSLRPLDHESYVKNACLPGPKITQPNAAPDRASRRLRTAAAAGLATVAILLTPFAARGSAPAPEMAFTRLGSSEGLSPGAVRTIVQDAQGFVWFGTEDGLDRYDGYELRHFSHRRSVPGTLPNNWISALARDASGRLWVGSDGGGLVWLDDSTGMFRSEDPQNHQPLFDPMGKVRALHVDHSGRLWIATRNAGMRGIDMLRHTSTVYRHDAAKDESLSDDSVYAMAEDASGSLWVGTSSGLDRLDPQSGHIEHFARQLHSAGVPANDPVKINAMCFDRLGNLWIALDTGLARLNLSTGSMSLMRHHDGDPSSLPAGAVTALLEDNEQRLWIGTTAGLALLDRPSGQFRVIRHDPASLDSLPDSNISSLFQDRSGLLWVGTKSGGAARWNPHSWSFGHHRFADQAADSITSFAVDQRGTLWVGSLGAGVAAIDPRTGATVRYRSGAESPVRLHDDAVMALLVDDRDRVWLGTMNNGIDRLDAARHELTHFKAAAGDPSALPAAGVMSLLRDRRGRIWVGSYGGGVAMIDPLTDRVLRYDHGRDDGGALLGDRATALVEDPAGLIWIGTDGSGLNVLDPLTGRFAHFLHDPNDGASLSSDTVYALNVDAAGVLWVGTRGGGLDRVAGVPFSKGGVRFVNVSESEGLPNNTVYGIESDAKGVLWVSTNRGLASVQHEGGGIRGFQRDHGLQSDEFNFGAHYRGPDGTLYFGGNNGYNAFIPQRLELSEAPPSVVLTDVLSANMRVSASPDRLRHVDLGYRDSVVTFQFAALDFTSPSNVRYRYRLEGFDNDWIDAGATRQATYTRLDAGDYVFRVRATDDDGRWSERPGGLSLHVAPPPWTTWWAKTIYACGACGLVLLVVLAQNRRVQREVAYASRLKLEVEERTAELAERNHDMERANRKLREISVSDSLTGLGNRRFLQEALAVMASEAARGTIGDCVLMIVDLDRLKPINDEYGHEGGDAVLIQVAEILRREFRPSDLIGRWGGDEFVIVCRDTDIAVASTLAERVRSSIAKRIFRIDDGLAARTSCSIGFAPIPFIPGEIAAFDWEQSLSVADLALYEAKQNRNQWIGWAGTEKAANLPSILADLAASPAALEIEGYLTVSRRPSNPEETVDRLRPPRFPAPKES